MIDKVDVIEHCTGWDGPGRFDDIQAQAVQPLDDGTVRILVPSLSEYQGAQPMLIEQIQNILSLPVNRTYVKYAYSETSQWRSAMAFYSRSH